MSESPRPRLIVCTTCQAGAELAPGETAPGALLHAALADLLAARADPPVELRAATCMANCERGCSAAIALPGKWIYVLAHLTPAHAADLLTYAGAYAASASGTVMPSRRPASLGRAVLARVPALEFAA